MQTGRTILIAIELLAASIWVGSLVCLALVSRVATRTLDAPSRVALFRGIGRDYARVGTGALLIAIVVGVLIAGWPSDWEVAVTVAVILSVVLVAFTAVGMAQARRMTFQRQRAFEASHDEAIALAIRRGAALAGVLRGGIALLTLVVIVLCAYAIAG